MQITPRLIGSELNKIVNDLFTDLSDKPITKKTVTASLLTVSFKKRLSNLLLNSVGCGILALYVRDQDYMSAGVSIIPNGQHVSNRKRLSGLNTILASEPDAILSGSFRKAILQLSSDIPNQTLKASPFSQMDLVIQFSLWFFKKAEDGTFLYPPSYFSATLLHEIGHYVYLLKLGETLYDNQNLFSDAVTYVVSHPKKTEITEIIKTILTIPRLPVDLQKYGMALLAYTGSETDPDYPLYCDSVSWFIASVSSAMSRTGTAEIIGKSRDMTDTGDRSTAERYADRFTVDAGYGSQMAAVLTEAHATSNTYRLLSGKTHMVDTLSVVGMFLDHLSEFIEFSSETDIVGYDVVYKRLRLLIDGSKASLHNPDLSPQEREALLETISLAEQKYTEYTNKKAVIFRRSVAETIKEIGAAAMFIPSLFQSGVQKTYAALQDTGFTFKNNQLAYFSEKLTP